MWMTNRTFLLKFRIRLMTLHHKTVPFSIILLNTGIFKKFTDQWHCLELKGPHEDALLCKYFSFNCSMPGRPSASSNLPGTHRLSNKNLPLTFHRKRTRCITWNDETYFKSLLLWQKFNECLRSGPFPTCATHSSSSWQHRHQALATRTVCLSITQKCFYCPCVYLVFISL